MERLREMRRAQFNRMMAGKELARIIAGIVKENESVEEDTSGVNTAYNYEDTHSDEV